MKKRIAIIGRGAAGAITAAHFSFYKPDCEIDWYYDPSIPTQPVGEGSAVNVPNLLNLTLGFTYEDLKNMDGTVKTGIYKKGWGQTGEEFFTSIMPSAVATHFNAKKLHEFVLNRLRGRVNIIEKNIRHQDIDSDFIMDCSGRPNSFDNCNKSDYIPVNSVIVNQCYWDFPKFNTSFAIARKYGWVFAIPLQNRCAIGYLFNKDFNTENEVIEDRQEIFKEFNLIPSASNISFEFNSYRRKNNFIDNRVCYNGNSSYFLEPLEASSFGLMEYINRIAYDVWDGRITSEQADLTYNTELDNIEHMIMLHYFAGSVHKTKFWDFAQQRGELNIKKAIQKTEVRNSYLKAISAQNIHHSILLSGFDPSIGGEPKPVGQWPIHTYYTNIKGLGITDKLSKLL